MPVKSVALGAAAAALAVALLAWMLSRVAEQPGVPREVGAPPPWFAGVQAPVPARYDGGARKPPETSSEATPEAAPPTPDEPFVQVEGGTVEIVLTEYEMKPNRIRARPGTIKFVVRNEGRFAHNFHVEGAGVDTTAEKFSPGRTLRLELGLGTGEYKISCPLSNHDQRGMHGRLVIAAKEGS